MAQQSDHSTKTVRPLVRAEYKSTIIIIILNIAVTPTVWSITIQPSLNVLRNASLGDFVVMQKSKCTNANIFVITIGYCT